MAAGDVDVLGSAVVMGLTVLKPHERSCSASQRMSPDTGL